MKRLLILFPMLLLLSACDTQPQESSSVPTEIIISGAESTETAEASLFPLEIQGVQIHEEADRVVSLSPAVTEMIAEMGYTDRLCGISSYCDYPELTLQKLGSAENPELEIITGLAPDVVFTLSALSERDIYTLEDAGIAVVKLVPPVSAEGYGRLYSDIASAFVGAEAASEQGERYISDMRTAAESVKLDSFVYVTGKLTVAGSATFENGVLSLCGENLCEGEGYCELSVLGENMPKYIVASDTLSMSDINSDDVLSDFVDNGAQVLFVSASGFERPSTRTLAIYTQISEQLAPVAE